MEIYKERFSNARGWTFYLVGSFDESKIKPLIASYLGSLPATSASGSSFRDLGVRPVKGVVKKEIRKGKEQQSQISMAFTGEAAFTEENQLILRALIDLLNIKITETLREKLSGIYAGGMSGALSKDPYNSYTINISLPCGPENVDKLIKATLAEIQKVKDAGPTMADLNKVKEAFSKQYLENIKDNGYWIGRLQRNAELGTDPSGILTLDQRMSAITTRDLQEAAKKYFNMNNYFQALLYPEK